jgi:hypothetical protein
VRPQSASKSLHPLVAEAMITPEPRDARLCHLSSRRTLSASSAHRASIFYLRASTQSGHFLPAILAYITPRAYVMQPNGLYFPMAFSLRLTGPLELSQIMETFYRRSRQANTWHFCGNCESWPLSDYEEKNTQDPPISGFCLNCIETHREGRCEWVKLEASPSWLKKSR